MKITSSQPSVPGLVDHSPPNGDFASYIEELMRRSEAATVSHAAHLAESVTSSPAQATRALPVKREGPPDLAELLSKWLKRPGLAKGEGLKAKDAQPLPAWWLWVAGALIIVGVIFPYGMGWLMLVVFVLWRMAKSSAGRGRKKS